MSGTGAWQTANTDVRTLMSDGPLDKLRWRKKLLGQIDGTNTTFKTFEARRITALVTATAPLGVYVNNAIVTVSSEDMESGELYLASAPAPGASVHASYYVQWFDDSEIVQFLVSASEWITGIDDYTSIPNNQWPCAKTYAAAAAYQKLSIKFATNLAETYQLYDAPDEKRFDPVKVYSDMATKMFKLAFELRDDTYKNRQGQALAPIFATRRGRVKDVAPNR
jgi:hypothetical protein